MADGKTEGGCISDGIVGALMLDLACLPLGFLLYEKAKSLIYLNHYLVTFSVTCNLTQPTLTQISSGPFIMRLYSVICSEGVVTEAAVCDGVSDAAGCRPSVLTISLHASPISICPLFAVDFLQPLGPALFTRGAAWRLFQELMFPSSSPSENILPPMTDGTGV